MAMINKGLPFVIFCYFLHASFSHTSSVSAYVQELEMNTNTTKLSIEEDRDIISFRRLAGGGGGRGGGSSGGSSGGRGGGPSGGGSRGSTSNPTYIPGRNGYVGSGASDSRHSLVIAIIVPLASVQVIHYARPHVF